MQPPPASLPRACCCAELTPALATLRSQSALLEMERIYITLESELSLTSSLVDQLLQAVVRYGELETVLHEMVSRVQRDCHGQVDERQLHLLERDIGALVLQLGLADSSAQESFSWKRTQEAVMVNAKKARDGVEFYSRGVQLFGQDVQLLVNMLGRAVLQGYTLQPREVKLLRRIAKDTFTLIPFIVILLIPLSPLGHVLVFSFIQRFFPDFYPSQFTESRQNIMSMYSSITSSAGPIASPFDATETTAQATDGPSSDSAEGGMQAGLDAAAESPGDGVSVPRVVAANSNSSSEDVDNKPV